MPIKTNLNILPYFDDYSSSTGYYKFLFKPSVAVQARELNGIQSALQNQIEKFGNNIFKNGSIIDGCNFRFYNGVSYIKIKDIQLDGLIANPENYKNFNIRNSNNLIASIVDVKDGFESTDPDLKTLYLNYVNYGNSSVGTFSPGEVLSVYDSNNSIFRINILSSGSGYSNNDNIVITPRLVINVTSGIFQTGDTITDTTTGAQSIIVDTEDLSTRTPYANLGGTISVQSGNTTIIGTGTSFTRDFNPKDHIALYTNSTAYSLYRIDAITNDITIVVNSAPSYTNTSVVYSNVTPSNILLSVRPTITALTNRNISSENWTFSSNSMIQGATVNDTADVISVNGSGANGILITDSIGRIQLVAVTQRGFGYNYTPIVSVQSSSGSLSSLEAQNYYAQILVSSAENSVGTGYGFGISNGVFYQKGYFIDVLQQDIIVSKYNILPNNVVVVLDTKEEIINSNIDTSLVDNALGTPNFSAPGSDRLKLTAELKIISASELANNTNYYALVSWSDGIPFKQNQFTEYNILQDAMARRTVDESGDYVVDRFNVTTRATSNSLLESTKFDIVVDPGTAYIDGYKVITTGNYNFTVDKVVDTKLNENTKVSLNYDNYIIVNEVGGLFKFDNSPLVEFYDTSKGFISNTSLIISGNTNPVGNKIGEARIRNMVLDTGSPGLANTSYKLYLFNIKMNTGKNFNQVKSVYYNGVGVDGIADLVLNDYDFTSSNSTVNVYRPKLFSSYNSLVFGTGFESILNSNNIFYTYRITANASISNSGIVTVSLVSSPDTNFPYTGTLTNLQKNEIQLVPSANLISYNIITSSAVTNSSSNTITTTDQVFLNNLSIGDYIFLYANATTSTIKRVQNITNNTSLTVDSNPSFTGSSIEIRKAWPQYVSIPLEKSVYTANVTGTNNEILNINIANTINISGNTDVTIVYNVEKQETVSTSKTINRDIYVKLQLSNNEGSTNGPWCLGIPDIFRLKNVYLGNSTVSPTSLDITSEFYIDHNQNVNYYDLGYLYKNKKSSLILTDDDYLLVKFDAFTASPGFYNITSYVSGNLNNRTTNDRKTLTELKATNSLNTFEIPEMYSYDGKYYDLISCVDFRPYVTNTANYETSFGSATLNPNSTVDFGNTTRYYPVPGSILRQDVEEFLPRIDNVVIDKNSSIKNIYGSPGVLSRPNKQTGTMILNSLYIPGYPNIVQNESDNINSILDVKTKNENLILNRVVKKTITTISTNRDLNIDQPKRYTMEDIGNLDRRIKDLEYYVSLSQTESLIKDKTIPSSLSPNINRFKYGFYVDDYTTLDFTEFTNPEYAASFESNTLVTPLISSIPLKHKALSGNTNYDEILITEQSLATYYIPPPPPPSNTPRPTPTPGSSAPPPTSAPPPGSSAPPPTSAPPPSSSAPPPTSAPPPSSSAPPPTLLSGSVTANVITIITVAGTNPSNGLGAPGNSSQPWYNTLNGSIVNPSQVYDDKAGWLQGGYVQQAVGPATTSVSVPNKITITGGVPGQTYSLTTSNPNNTIGRTAVADQNGNIIFTKVGDELEKEVKKNGLDSLNITSNGTSIGQVDINIVTSKQFGVDNQVPGA